MLKVGDARPGSSWAVHRFTSSTISRRAGTIGRCDPAGGRGRKRCRKTFGSNNTPERKDDRIQRVGACAGLEQQAGWVGGDLSVGPENPSNGPAEGIKTAPHLLKGWL